MEKIDNTVEQMTTLVTHTHIKGNEIIQSLLYAYGDVYAEIKHRYAKHLTNHSNFSTLTRKEQKTLVDPLGCLPYRVFRSIEQNVKGLQKSQKSHFKNALVLALETVKTKKERYLKSKRLFDILKKTHPTKELRQTLHFKKAFRVLKSLHRAFQISQRNVDKLQIKVKNETNSVCFGTKKRMKARHRLHTQDKEGIARWQREWRDHRTSEVHFTGSHDKAMGNPNAHVVF